MYIYKHTGHLGSEEEVGGREGGCCSACCSCPLTDVWLCQGSASDTTSVAFGVAIPSFLLH